MSKTDTFLPSLNSPPGFPATVRYEIKKPLTVACHKPSSHQRSVTHSQVYTWLQQLENCFAGSRIKRLHAKIPDTPAPTIYLDLAPPTEFGAYFKDTLTAMGWIWEAGAGSVRIDAYVNADLAQNEWGCDLDVEVQCLQEDLPANTAGWVDEYIKLFESLIWPIFGGNRDWWRHSGLQEMHLSWRVQKPTSKDFRDAAERIARAMSEVGFVMPPQQRWTEIDPEGGTG